MKVIGFGIHSTVYTNEKDAIKIVKPEFEDLYIKELFCLKYLNIVLPDRTWFPKITDFSLSKLSISLELLEDSLGKVLKTTELNKENRNKYLIQILQAFSDLHTLGIAHNNVRMSNILIKSDKQNICLIDFGESVKFRHSDGYRNFNLDSKGIASIMLNLSLGEKFEDKNNPKAFSAKINSLEPKISNEIKSLIRDKKHVSKILLSLGVPKKELYRSKIRGEIESPIYNIDIWVRAVFKRFELDRTFDPIVVTTIICTIMERKDAEYIIPYGILIVYIYSCIYGGNLKIKNCVEICPKSFGNPRFRRTLFGYLLDELLRTDDLIIMMYQGLE